MKLRLAFHATGHNDRERREPGEFEVMRGEEPKAQWFPKKEEWPAMIAAQEMPPLSLPEPAAAPRMRM